MAQKKTTSKTSTKPRTKTTKKSAKKNDNSEVKALLTVVLSLIWAALLYIPGGDFGPNIRNFFLGLLGYPVFLMPIWLLVYGAHMAMGKGFKETKRKYYESLSGIIVLSAIFALFANKPVNPFTSLSVYWYYGKQGVGGGIIGGFICDIIAKPLSSVVAGIVLFAALILIIMMLTHWSPLKALLRLLVNTYRKIKKAQAERMIEDDDDEEKISEPVQQKIDEEELPKKAKKSKFKIFDDDEITRTDKKEKKKSAEKSKKESKEENSTDAEKTANDEIYGKPYDDEDYIPPSLRDVVVDDEDSEDIDEIVNSAIDDTFFVNDEKEEEIEKVEENVSPIETEQENEEVTNDFDDAPFDADETDDDFVPEKVTGMEDVSAEMEQAFERIPYTFPDLNLLNLPPQNENSEASKQEIKETAQKLVATLKSFNVDAKLINVSKGPTVTRYELKPGDGVKVSKIVGLSDDIALHLAASSARIEAPIPNKEAIGIEIPNKTVDTVYVRDVLGSPEFKNYESNLGFVLGKDISGKIVVADIGKMPHLLVAGATGSGKSVCINTLITSIIYKADPNEVKFIMVDPKMVELGVYNGIPHLMIPVVTDPRRASGALYWAVQEMERRYSLFAESNVRDLKGYNAKLKEEGIDYVVPHIVIIIDELRDLMMVAPGEVEESIERLAQKARAAGMHLVLATQRPSVDVITGRIKGNIPSRIGLSVKSVTDSRTILDMGGAEKLLGHGDMLFAPIGSQKPVRIQGAFISDKEVERVVDFVKGMSVTKYDEDIMEKIDNGKPVNINDASNNPEDDADELLPRAIEIAVDTGKISASYIQRRLKVGFSRAARIIDQMEDRGLIGPQDGSKPREVLITKEDYMEMSMRS